MNTLTPTATLQWIPSDLYNRFLEVEKARVEMPALAQIAVTQALASTLSPVLGPYIESLGTILTHQHHELKIGQSVLGKRVGDELQFTPRVRKGDECPTSWVVIQDPRKGESKLLRFEGIISTSATDHMRSVANLVEQNAQVVLQALTPHLQALGYSSICLGLYPGLSLGDEEGKRFYLETTDKTTSYVKAREQDVCETQKNIPTFVAIKTIDGSFLSACMSWCILGTNGRHTGIQAHHNTN